MAIVMRLTPAQIAHQIKQGGWREKSRLMIGTFHAPSIDEVVKRAFFEALRPAQLDALEAMLKQEMAERKRLDKYWRDQQRRAEYEARLAQRQYDAVDPDNRLVARACRIIHLRGIPCSFAPPRPFLFLFFSFSPRLFHFSLLFPPFQASDCCCFFFLRFPDYVSHQLVQIQTDHYPLPSGN